MKKGIAWLIPIMVIGGMALLFGGAVHSGSWNPIDWLVTAFKETVGFAVRITIGLFIMVFIGLVILKFKPPMKITIVLLAVMVIAGIVTFMMAGTLYYETTAVPCTYAGCENDVQCPAGYTKSGCTVPGDCICRKVVTCAYDADCSAIGDVCGNQVTLWSCSNSFCNYECSSTHDSPFDWKIVVAVALVGVFVVFFLFRRFMPIRL